MNPCAPVGGHSRMPGRHTPTAFGTPGAPCHTAEESTAEAAAEAAEEEAEEEEADQGGVPTRSARAGAGRQHQDRPESRWLGVDLPHVLRCHRMAFVADDRAVMDFPWSRS